MATALLLGILCGATVSALLFVAAALLSGRHDAGRQPDCVWCDYDGEWEGS